MLIIEFDKENKVIRHGQITSPLMLARELETSHFDKWIENLGRPLCRAQIELWRVFGRVMREYIELGWEE